MKKARLELLGALPGSAAIPKALERFAQKQGVLTSHSDALLKAHAKLLPEDSLIDAVPLGELVGRFLMMMGQPSQRMATTGQKLAALALACSDANEESPFARSARFVGLHKLLDRTLDELHYHGLTPEILRQAATKAPEPLKSKLHDLVTLDERMLTSLGQAGRETLSQRIQRCLGEVPKQPFPIERVFMVAGGEYQPLLLDWLQWLVAAGVQVSLLVEEAGPAQNLFHQTRHIADHLGVEVSSLGESQSWTLALFGGALGAFEAPEIRISSTSDPLAECETALRACLESTGKGIFPHRIVLFSRDAELYAPLLTASAKRLGVPLQADVQVPLLTNGFASLTLATLEALASRDVRRLLRLLKSSYLSLSGPAQEQAETIIRESYRARERQWQELSIWARQHHEEQPWLAHILDWRQEAEQNRLPLSRWLDRLRLLMGEVDLLSQASEASPTKERDLRAQVALQRALADYASITDANPERAWTFGELVSLCRRLWEEETVTLPTPASGVRFAYSTESIGECQVLIALGMLEGSLPRRRTEDPILSDEERSTLSELAGLKIPLANSFDRAAAERDEFVRLCSAPKKQLILSYPQTDESRDNVPAFYLQEVENLLGETVQKQNIPRQELAPLLNACLSPADHRLREALEGKRLSISPPRLQGHEAREKIRHLSDGASPRELSEVLTCPFRAAFRHRLGVWPPTRQVAWNRLRQIPIEARLAAQPDPDSARRALHAAIDAEILRLFPVLESWELATFEAGARRLVEDWVRREFTAREIWPKDENATKFDPELGGPELKNDPCIDGKTIHIKGQAAALSSIEHYSVLQLYETASIDLKTQESSSELNEDLFRYGLYLLTQAKRNYPGIALEIDTIRGGSGEGERFLAVLPRLEGSSLHSKNEAGCKIIDLGERRGFFTKIREQLGRSISLLNQATAEPTPGKACENCDYGELCRSSKEYGETVTLFENSSEVAL